MWRKDYIKFYLSGCQFITYGTLLLFPISLQISGNVRSDAESNGNLAREGRGERGGLITLLSLFRWPLRSFAFSVNCVRIDNNDSNSRWLHVVQYFYSEKYPRLSSLTVRRIISIWIEITVFIYQAIDCSPFLKCPRMMYIDWDSRIWEFVSSFLRYVI